MYVFEEETFRIRGALFEVYNRLGIGLQENVYQAALEKELIYRKVPYESQRKIGVEYRNELLVPYFVIDFLCFDKIIIEIKSTERLSKKYHSQLLNYLRLSNKQLGLLVNFNSYPDLEIDRVINSIRPNEAEQRR